MGYVEKNISSLNPSISSFQCTCQHVIIQRKNTVLYAQFQVDQKTMHIITDSWSNHNSVKLESGHSRSTKEALTVNHSILHFSLQINNSLHKLHTQSWAMYIRGKRTSQLNHVVDYEFYHNTSTLKVLLLYKAGFLHVYIWHTRPALIYAPCLCYKEKSQSMHQHASSIGG